MNACSDSNNSFRAYFLVSLIIVLKMQVQVTVASCWDVIVATGGFMVHV